MQWRSDLRVHRDSDTPLTSRIHQERYKAGSPTGVVQPMHSSTRTIALKPATAETQIEARKDWKLINASSFSLLEGRIYYT